MRKEGGRDVANVRRGEADGDERVNEVAGYVCAVVCPEEQSPHGLGICGGA